MKLIERIKEELKVNNNKISQGFIELESSRASKQFFCTNNTVICVMRLDSGHEVVAYAQVLDEKNFNEDVGKRVAADKCKDKLWELFGNIAKAIM